MVTRAAHAAACKPDDARAGRKSTPRGNEPGNRFRADTGAAAAAPPGYRRAQLVPKDL